ncbi:MAG: O-antigen ligase family protein [Acidobacteria bacterium]|nr:O-antigen ligase family protein [Acidobacteriota bacterium]
MERRPSTGSGKHQITAAAALFAGAVAVLTVNEVAAVPAIARIQGALTLAGLAAVLAAALLSARCDGARAAGVAAEFRRPRFLLPTAFLVWLLLSLAGSGFSSEAPSTPWVMTAQVVLFGAACVSLRPDRPGAGGALRAVVLLAGALVAFEAVFGVFQFAVVRWRVGGTTANVNHFAGLLAVGAPLLAGLAAGAFGGGWRRVAGATALPLAAASLVFSGSRGALAGLLLGAVAALALRALARRRRRAAFALLALLAAGLGQMIFLGVRFAGYYARYAVGQDAARRLPGAFVGNTAAGPEMGRFYDFNADGRLDARDLVLAEAKGRSVPPELARARAVPLNRGFAALQWHRLKNLLTLPDDTAAVRVFGFQAAVQLFREHPVLGVGPGNYTRAVPPFLPRPDVAVLRYHTHCLPTHLAAELGLPGLLFWLAGVALFVAGFHRGMRVSPGPWRDPVFWLGAALLVLLAANLLDVNVFYRPLRWQLPLLAAAFAACRFEITEEDPREKTTPLKRETPLKAAESEPGMQAF